MTSHHHSVGRLSRQQWHFGPLTVGKLSFILLFFSFLFWFYILGILVCGVEMVLYISWGVYCHNVDGLLEKQL